MADKPLQGVGVLVTRPRAQAVELVSAIEQQGGTAVCFPVIEIAPRARDAIATEAARLPAPDLVIFVSRNAVENGLDYIDGGRIAVIGPATARAVTAAGREVDIRPAAGYDSEHLLAEAALQDVAGKNVRIIRGSEGRELLATELRARGARVDYLSVYARRRPATDAQTLAELEDNWRSGGIGVVTIMSVQSLDNLEAMLPAWCLQQLDSTPLVTPAGRVIKEILDRHPASRPVLATGPQADDMVRAIIAQQSATPE